MNSRSHSLCSGVEEQWRISEDKEEVLRTTELADLWGAIKGWSDKGIYGEE